MASSPALPTPEPSLRRHQARASKADGKQQHTEMARAQRQARQPVERAAGQVLAQAGLNIRRAHPHQLQSPQPKNQG